jgi:hypothetical protein
MAWAAFFSRLSSTCSSSLAVPGTGPARVELADDGLALEVETDGQVEVVAGDFHRLVDQRRQVAGRHLAVAAAAEAEHVGDDLRRPGAGLLNAVEQLRHFAAVQVAVDRRQVDAQLFGLLLVLRQLGDRRRRMFCTLCRIAPSGLLISWAMPAARPPTESIFSDCTIISSSDRRWVMSSIRITTPRPAPPISG